MKPPFVLLLFLLSILFLSFITKENIVRGIPRLPVYVSYKYNTGIIPDSIKNAVNLCLKSKKVKVLTNQDELTALVANEINSSVTSLISSNGLNERTAKNIGDKIDPVGNIVAVQIFNSQQNEKEFIIDSIYWRTKTVPSKDSTWRHKEMFIPDSIAKLNTSAALSLFIDKVLLSGYLQ